MSAKKPDVASEVSKIGDQLDKIDESMSLHSDVSSEKPRTEMDTRLSSREIANSKDIYLKPKRRINANNQKFNEKFREQYEFAKQYVKFIAEHKEIIGEKIEVWTRPYGGIPAEEWEVPTGKPVWGPRYLAEQIKRCHYRKLTMQEDVITSSDGMGKYTGALTVESEVQRLDAYPVQTKTSIFI